MKCRKQTELLLLEVTQQKELLTNIISIPVSQTELSEMQAILPSITKRE